MGTTPTTVNGAVKTADEIIQAAIYDVAVNGVVAYLQAEVPVLAFPIISTVFRYAVTKLATLLYNYLSVVVTFSIIDHQTISENNAYVSAVSDLRAAHASGDSNALKAARDKFKSTLGNLIHFDGS